MKLISIFILFFSFVTFADSGFNLDEILVNSTDSENAMFRKTRFLNLKGEYRSLVHFKETLRIMASDGGYQSFFYEIVEINNQHKLIIDFILKPIVKEINIKFTNNSVDSDPAQYLSIREGDFFEIQKLEENIQALKKKLETMGYPDNEVIFDTVEQNNQTIINISITLGKPRVFKKIRTNASSKYIQEYLNKKFYELYNKPFDVNRFKLFLDDAQKELFSYGYYLLNLDFAAIFKGKRVILDINVSNDKLFAFDFQNLHEERRNVIHSLVIDLFRKYKRVLPEQNLRQAILEFYRKKALLNVDVKITTSQFKNKYLETINLYRIEFHEKNKTRVKSLIFNGSDFYTPNELLKLYKREAFELASIDYYDEDFLDYFVGYLKTRYIKDGYVQANIQGPMNTFSEDKTEVKIEFDIQEGQRSIIRSIEFAGLPEDYESKVRDVLKNKVDLPFNPIELTEDIRRVASTLQENGYYFAEVENANEDSLVQYSKSGRDVSIKYVINTGPMVHLNRVLFIGNNKTRKKALLRRIYLDKGDTITPSKTKEIETNLASMGLFTSVSVTPMRHNSKNTATDLIVKLVEREFGLVEFAPGFRTDLGLKLTGTISYLNIGGMNRSVSLREQLNQRLNYQTFDPRRRQERKSMIEHSTSLNYSESYIFNSEIDYASSLSYQRKRFYSFDADIFRWSHTFTRDLTRTLSSSIRYQYEQIAQWDATQARDNGSFQIGAITPGLVWDLRNSPILPVKGAMFNLSCEFANPYFLSQKTQDLTINYYKLISRNRFYIPFERGTVAISVLAGVQENLATKLVRDANGNPVIVDGVKQTEGYIPNIKVFRLTGADIIRGFTDEEANRLLDGSDISQARIQKRAYLADIKIEPRYIINDNFMAGVFYDAGRVFVDQVDMGELRDSVGLTFKILTPVGTLDFDYGRKLLRKRNAGGNLEDPGRFHVSIGFF